MARKTGDVNKSEMIRELFRANPRMKASEVASELATKGIEVKPALIYFVKGRMKGRKAKKRRTRMRVAEVAKTTTKADTLAVILKVKKLASEVGSMRKLRSLVEALS